MVKFKTKPEVVTHLLRGQLALAEVERRGVRVDRGALDATMERMDRDIAKRERKLMASKVWKTWQRVYGHKANIGSKSQLRQVLFGEMGYAVTKKTGKAEVAAVDKDVLEKIDHPFVRRLMRFESMKKTEKTYLVGLKRELVQHSDGYWYVHPSYNLNIARSIRSSCDKPNFQNNPVRDPEIAEIVRRLYVPYRADWHFGEIDQAQVEVRVAATYNEDPVMIKYIKDKSTDMHRDSACEIFLLEPGQVIKEARHAAKNQFVFPEFFGSCYFQIAPAIWDAMTRRKLTAGVDGPPMKDWLRKKGIAELGDCDPDRIKSNGTKAGTFVHHMKAVEDKLWKRFAVYKQWKRQWFERYQRDGGFGSHFGFAWNTPMSRNESVNYPIQCDAFHVGCLWPLIRLVERMRKSKMKSFAVGEIHDSIQFSIHPKEVDDVLNLARRVMVDEAMEAHPWINVPLEVECEVAPAGEPWFAKKEWTMKSDGHWSIKN